MARLLYIESSPRKERSTSIEVAKAFLKDYQASHPKDEIKTIDLWKKELPPFDGDVIDSKYAILNGQSHTDAQKKAWKAVEDIITDFKSADKYLISIPMWNFGIPYKLKHFFDVIVQPGYTFSYIPQEGYKGLVTGKNLAIVYARGGSYPAGSEAQNLDLQTSYMNTILGFIGFKDIKEIIVEPTLGANPEQRNELINKAKQQAKKEAEAF